MIRNLRKRENERGATLLEFAIGASVFCVAMFGVVEYGRLMWTHNALSDAARRGARYAINHAAGDAAAVKNVVVYGAPEGGDKPVVANLTTANVQVQYSNFGLNAGTVSVSITGYQFQFVVPVIGTTISMPNYNTTLTGENAGLVPPNM
ncbi:MAG TPA: TadE/TadG family type IV pilus assembly protein [Pyrinomonadaceae bacterium]|nr:TadE/TadG family type IV pilus assembly protein [Pyrinomonadaceae bacterium]